jgi:hypothetical protein
VLVGHDYEKVWFRVRGYQISLLIVADCC